VFATAGGKDVWAGMKPAQVTVDMDEAGLRKINLYAVPAIVEACEKDQHLSTHTEYHRSTATGSFGPQNVTVPVTHVSASHTYEAYFVTEEGLKIHRTFLANPGFIAGYRAVLVDVGMDGFAQRWNLGVLNVESKKDFHWKIWMMEGFPLFKAETRPILSWIAFIVSFLFWIAKTSFALPLVVVSGFFVARNWLRSRHNKRMDAKMKKASRALIDTYRHK